MARFRPTSLLFAATLLIIAACTPSTQPGNTDAPLPLNKFDDQKVLKIHDLGDRRLGDSLVPFLTDSNPNYRREAAIAMASVQGGSVAATNQLRVLTGDQDAGVQKAALWAVGQVGDSALCGDLLNIIQSSKAEIQNVAAEALGKAGSARQIQAAFDGLKSSPDRTHSGTVRMIYRAGLRKIVPQGALEYALTHVNDSQSPAEDQLHIAAYLGRVADLGPLTDPSAVLTALQSSPNTDIKQHLVKSLRRCDKPECADQLRAIIADPKQPTAVRVNAIRAAGNVHPIAAEANIAVLDADQQVAVTAAEHIRDNVKQDHSQTLAICRKLKAWRPRAILLVAAMKDAQGHGEEAALKEVTGFVDSLYNQAGAYEKGALLHALAEDRDQPSRLEEIALKVEPIVSMYAAEALIAYHDHYATRDQQKLQNWASTVKRLLRTGDPGLIAMTAEHLAGSGPQPKLFLVPIGNTGCLDSALSVLKLPQDIEAYNAVEKAIAAFYGKEPQLTKLEHGKAIDWALVKRIPTAQTAEIQTNKGKIVFQLQVEDAPGSVANFVKLVQQGFYKDKYFHRVVPAFVAQGGCPRGDGWGSSPETIRSEWPMLHYGRGAVGMASAGKDTESCQWFITHCDVPHLDGRYTIFAHVTQGMDIVDKLEIGDQIQSIALPGL